MAGSRDSRLAVADDHVDRRDAAVVFNRSFAEHWRFQPLDPDAAWGLGVVGSTRMEYARMIALVEHVARTLNQSLQELRS